ncbi:hypothetical protein ACRAWF_20120 [Streptomyces sp. L7]
MHTGRGDPGPAGGLAAHPSVERVEAAHPLFPELDISRSDIRADPVAEAPGHGGDTVIAVLDSGIDCAHPNFRHQDGSSRILFLWDQTARTTADGAAVPYGAEYTAKELDRALAADTPLLQEATRTPGTDTARTWPVSQPATSTTAAASTPASPPRPT